MVSDVDVFNVDGVRCNGFSETTNQINGRRFLIDFLSIMCNGHNDIKFMLRSTITTIVYISLQDGVHCALWSSVRTGLWSGGQ